MAQTITTTCDYCEREISKFDAEGTFWPGFKLSFDEQYDHYREGEHRNWDVCSVGCAQAVLELYVSTRKAR